MNYLMGIDLGSTSLKAVIYDLDGNLIASGSRRTELFHPHADHPGFDRRRCPGLRYTTEHRRRVPPRACPRRCSRALPT